jgi:hypothetical protein
MTCTSSAAFGRRAAVARPGIFRFMALFLLGLLALAWSGSSAAQTCDLVPVGPTTLDGAPGENLVFQFEMQTACGASNTGTITLTTGAGLATVSAATFGPVGLNTPVSFTVTVLPGATYPQEGIITVVCTSAATGCNPAFTRQDFRFRIVADYVYDNGPATTTNVIQNKPFTLQTLLTIAGAPGNIPSRFSNGAVATPDGSGLASTTLSEVLAGTYGYDANLECDALSPPGCDRTTDVNFTVVVEHPTLRGDPNPMDVFVGESAEVVVTYTGDISGVPAPDGTNILWSTDVPVNGTLTGFAVAGGAGEARAVFSPDAGGRYILTANTGCTACGAGQVVTRMINGIEREIAIDSGNNQTAYLNQSFSDLVVYVQNNDGASFDPIPSVTINWSVVSGTATITPGGPTDGQGLASAQITTTDPGTIRIRAERADYPLAFVDDDGGLRRPGDPRARHFEELQRARRADGHAAGARAGGVDGSAGPHPGRHQQRHPAQRQCLHAGPRRCRRQLSRRCHRGRRSGRAARQR